MAQAVFGNLFIWSLVDFGNLFRWLSAAVRNLPVTALIAFCKMYFEIFQELKTEKKNWNQSAMLQVVIKFH
jgi:hypothetical protein